MRKSYKEDWGKLYQEKGVSHKNEHPDTEVVAFIAINFHNVPDRKKIKILDGILDKASIEHNSHQKIKRIVQEVYHVLKKDGIFFRLWWHGTLNNTNFQKLA